MPSLRGITGQILNGELRPLGSRRERWTPDFGQLIADRQERPFRLELAWIAGVLEELQ